MPNLIALDLSGSIVQVLEEHYGLRMVSAVQSISARMATEQERKQLGLGATGGRGRYQAPHRGEDGQPPRFLSAYCGLTAMNSSELSQE